jgi:hypothetical protein
MKVIVEGVEVNFGRMIGFDGGIMERRGLIDA